MILQSRPSLSDTTLRLVEESKALEAVRYLDSQGCQKNDYQALQGHLGLNARSGEVKQTTETIALPTITIYLGGAVSDPLGGWGCFIESKGKPKEASGQTQSASLPRMRWTAAIKSIETIEQPSEIRVITNDTVTVRTMNEWFSGWKANGGKKKPNGDPVANWDLLERLDRVMQDHEVTFEIAQGAVEGSNVDRACVLAQIAITQ